VRAYLIVIGLLLAIFGSIAGYLYLRFSALAATDFSPPPVTIASAISRAESWNSYLNAVGTIRAVRGIELSSETSGEITSLNFDSGDKVAANTLLLVLDDDIEQASRRNEIASLELAQILFDRDSKLVTKNSIPQSQYDQSKADLARAHAQLAETEARIENKRVYAPFGGTLGIRQVKIGDYVSPGTTIATLQDHSELEIDFTVPARHAPQLRPGLQLELAVNAFPEKTFAAELTAIDARVDPATRNLLIRARVSDSQGLLPGMFATLRVDLDQPRSVVTVPETSLTYSLQGNTVYIIEKSADGAMTAVAKVVSVGEVRDGRIAILGGVQAGEEVVTVGQNKLYRGAQVQVDANVKL
jgi:membrane fusion protein (multidrug efflux system)